MAAVAATVAGEPMASEAASTASEAASVASSSVSTSSASVASSSVSTSSASVASSSTSAAIEQFLVGATHGLWVEEPRKLYTRSDGELEAWCQASGCDRACALRTLRLFDLGREAAGEEIARAFSAQDLAGLRALHGELHRRMAVSARPDALEQGLQSS